MTERDSNKFARAVWLLWLGLAIYTITLFLL